MINRVFDICNMMEKKMQKYNFSKGPLLNATLK